MPPSPHGRHARLFELVPQTSTKVRLVAPAAYGIIRLHSTPTQHTGAPRRARRRQRAPLVRLHSIALHSIAYGHIVAPPRCERRVCRGRGYAMLRYSMLGPSGSAAPSSRRSAPSSSCGCPRPSTKSTAPTSSTASARERARASATAFHSWTVGTGTREASLALRHLARHHENSRDGGAPRTRPTTPHCG
jgi:hypothetical protein